MARNDWRRPFSSRNKDVKSTVVARIGCTPYTAPAYGQTCVRTLPYAYAVINSTTRNWAHLTLKHPQSPQNWGKVFMVGSRRVFVLFLILGRWAGHPMIFHIFPYLFYHRFLVSNCSKFCVKGMGSTVFIIYFKFWNFNRLLMPASTFLEGGKVGNFFVFERSSLKSAETGYSPRFYEEQINRESPKKPRHPSNYNFADTQKATRYFHSQLCPQGDF